MIQILICVQNIFVITLLLTLSLLDLRITAWNPESEAWRQAPENCRHLPPVTTSCRTTERAKVGGRILNATNNTTIINAGFSCELAKMFRLGHNTTFGRHLKTSF